ncbi:MAG: SDR family oxidoreductase [Pseudomonadota bacterium]|nr:SDR family oxidoreductase [Pseudomonadota bacterium]
MKTLILTGGSDGLGAAFGQTCLEKGYSIICLSRRVPGYGAQHIPVDLADPESIKAAAEQIRQKHPAFDAMVNCAGVFSQQGQGRISWEEIQRVLTVNTMAPLFLVSGLMDLIRKNGADILNVGSTVGYQGLC